jgi:hypothetical protein
MFNPKLARARTALRGPPLSDPKLAPGPSALPRPRKIIIGVRKLSTKKCKTVRGGIK